MMASSGVDAFSLEKEPDALRDAYGRSVFGQGCLLARRLIERGVPFVEVSLTGAEGAGSLGWDTHADNFNATRALCSVLDSGWSTLVTDLRDCGLLESTLIVWMGEFGRTPKINDNTGRDHWPTAWTTVFGGGGVNGGQVVGSTTDDGMAVSDRPVSVPDLIATVCAALGLDYTTMNISNVGRPVPLADHGATPIDEVPAT